jgi:hypothetical protein
MIPNAAVMNCAPHHLQGKIERFHETLKARMNLLVYTSPDLQFIMAWRRRLRPKAGEDFESVWTKMWTCNHWIAPCSGHNGVTEHFSGAVLPALLWIYQGVRNPRPERRLWMVQGGGVEPPR